MSVRPLIRLLGPGAIVKHYGPGPHDNGSPQTVHGRSGGGTTTLLSPTEAFGESFVDDYGNHRSVDDDSIQFFDTGGVSFYEGDLPTTPEARRLVSDSSEAESYWGSYPGAEGVRIAAAELTGTEAWEGVPAGGPDISQVSLTVGWDDQAGVSIYATGGILSDEAIAYTYLYELHHGEGQGSVTDTILYRGFDPQHASFSSGDIVEWGLASFSPDQTTALSFGNALFRLEPGEAGTKVRLTSDPQFEQLTGGRFEVVEVTQEKMGSQVYTIRQLDTFDPDAVIKVKTVRLDQLLSGSVASPTLVHWKATKLVKHYGPGPHPGTGTPQSVHGAPFLNVGVGETVNREVITDAEGNPAPISMAVLPPDVQAKVIAKAKEFGRTPEDIQANINMVFESAADRYELMDADRSWHDGDIAEWLKDREYDGYRDMLVEQKDGKWRWAKDAGTKLRDIDRFYASHHEWLYELAEDHDQPFGEVVGYHAAISPGLRAAENLRFSELAVQYWDANPKFTAEEAAYINEWLDADQQKILAKGGWRAERIAPQLDFEVEAGNSYRQVMDEAGPEAMARIMYRKTLHDGESLSLGRGYAQHATGLTMLYRDADVPTTLSGPKVRSFYNNIVDPFADRGDITIDFQTMDAAFNGHGTGDNDFPTDFVSKPAYKGVKLGVRPLVADAVRAGGQAISSRIDFGNAAEMQEVLWAEWKRGLPTSGNGRSQRHGEGKWGLEEIHRIS